MLRRFALCLTMMILLHLSSGAAAQVSISFDPATLEPGVATDLTMQLTDTSGGHARYTSIFLAFDLSNGLTLNDFSWMHDIADPGLWLAEVALYRNPPEASAVVWSTASDAGLAVRPNEEMVEVAVMNVTAAVAAAGTTQTITVIPANPTSQGITDHNYDNLEIDSGATFSVTVGGSGGTESGSTGGGGPGDPPMDNPDGPADPGDGGDVPTGSGNDDGDADDPDAHPDDVVVDEPGGDDPVAEGDDGETTGSSGSSDGWGVEPDGEPSDDAANETSNRPPFCGLGMVAPGLFTMAALFATKLLRPSRW